MVVFSFYIADTKANEAQEALDYAEQGIITATDKILGASIPDSVKDDMLVDLFAELPRVPEKACDNMNNYADEKEVEIENNENEIGCLF